MKPSPVKEKENKSVSDVPPLICEIIKPAKPIINATDIYISNIKEEIGSSC